MTVPESTLKLTIDVTHMTLGDAAIFDGNINPIAIRAFLLKYSDWPQPQIDAIEMGELDKVATQLVEQLKAAAVPLASAPPSANGHGSKRKRHPRGSAR